MEHRSITAAPFKVQPGEPVFMNFLDVVAGGGCSAVTQMNRPGRLGHLLHDRPNVSAFGDVGAFEVVSLKVGDYEEIVIAGIPLAAFVRFMLDGVLLISPISVGIEISMRLRNVSSATASVRLAFVPLVVS